MLSVSTSTRSGVNMLLRPSAGGYAVLATVCLAAFAINLDTTIVNVALPDLARRAGRDHPAAAVDRRRLQPGLRRPGAHRRLARRPVRPPAGAAGRPRRVRARQRPRARWPTPAAALIAVRFAMGAFAALIFPTTLSIITNTFPDRRERATAIGIWGAVTGLGVAIGPVTGGLLLAHYSWPSVFVALVPVALVALVAAAVLVPESRDPGQARLDLPGLVVSSAVDRPAGLHGDRGAPARLERPGHAGRLRRHRRARGRVRRDRAAAGAPDDRRLAVPHAGVLGRQRRR